jgi:hypothetical protein
MTFQLQRVDLQAQSERHLDESVIYSLEKLYPKLNHYIYRIYTGRFKANIGKRFFSLNSLYDKIKLRRMA